MNSKRFSDKLFDAFKAKADRKSAAAAGPLHEEAGMFGRPLTLIVSIDDEVVDEINHGSSGLDHNGHLKPDIGGEG